jgi:hypothetical protein
VRILLSAITAFSLIGAASQAADPRWTRVTTPHFVVSGDAPARDVRQVAVRLEMLSAVFARVLPGAHERSLLPTFVIVFGSDRAFRPYQPVSDGKAVPVGGYAIHDPLTPCMVIRLDRSGDAFRTMVHEYAHVLFDAPGRPLWLSEGLADYFSTTTLNRDRRHVILGDRIPDHVAQLSRWWVPIAQVVSTSRSAKISNDRNGLSFYAQSWLLVHYLTRRTPEHGAQLTRYLDLLAKGVGEVEAFEQAIGPPSRVDADLRRYVSNGILTGEEVTMPAQVGDAPTGMQPMSEAEVEATLGRLLFQLQRDDEALPRLNAALRLDPELAEAHATMGLMRLRQGRNADAVESFRRANAGAPANVPVAYYYALLELEASGAGKAPRLDDAYAALDRALVRRDGPPEPLAVLGAIAGRLGRLDEAEPLLRKAAERVSAPRQIRRRTRPFARTRGSGGGPRRGRRGAAACVAGHGRGAGAHPDGAGRRRRLARRRPGSCDRAHGLVSHAAAASNARCRRRAGPRAAGRGGLRRAPFHRPGDDAVWPCQRCCRVARRRAPRVGARRCQRAAAVRPASAARGGLRHVEGRPPDGGARIPAR